MNDTDELQILSSATRTAQARILCGECLRYHASVAEVWTCHCETADAMAEARAEMYAEIGSSAFMGGMSSSDASCYAQQELAEMRRRWEADRMDRRYGFAPTYR